MKTALIGNKNTIRTKYFLKAAAELGATVNFIPFSTLRGKSAFDFSILKNSFVKIDPPQYYTSHIQKIDPFYQRYSGILKKLSALMKDKDFNIQFLNTPNAIMDTLDKYTCKKRLEKAGVPVTPLVAHSIKSEEELNDTMRSKKLYSVFIKPRFGSGACGVAAYRLNPKSGRSVLTTSAGIIGGKLHNTKRLQKVEDSNTISLILQHLFSQDCVVEKWIPKANLNEKVFDLRVVYQFGKIDFIVVRQSSGCITNLHLNNDAASIDFLGLSDNVLRDIDSVCKKAMAQFKGLNSAGIDVLLKKGSLSPYIIEINGQGDLIYKDIFKKNAIYKKQILFGSNDIVV